METEERTDTTDDIDLLVSRAEDGIEDNYSETEGHELIEYDEEDGTVSVHLDMGEVYDQTVREDIDSQNAFYLRESGELEQFEEDISVALTEAFLKVSATIDEATDQFDDFNLDVVGSEDTSYGFTLSADKMAEISQELQKDMDKNRAPSARMVKFMKENGGVKFNGDRYGNVFYVSEGESTPVEVDGTETEISVKDVSRAGSEENRAYVEVDGEGDAVYHNSGTGYRLNGRDFAEIEEIGPLDERYDDGVAFRIDCDFPEFMMETGDETKVEGDTIEYISTTDEDSATVRINDEIYNFTEDEETYTTDSGTTYRVDQVIRTGEKEGAMKFEVINGNC